MFLGVLKEKIIICANCLSRIFGGGISDRYKLLIEAHRLEKSMCIKNQNLGRGIDRALSLVDVIRKNINSDCKFELTVAVSVLSSFVDYKEKIDADNKKLKKIREFLEEEKIKVLRDDNSGGSVKYKNVILNSDIINDLFLTRHSIRNFENDDIDVSLLKKAVSMAATAPSACNRQPTKVYFVSSKLVNERLGRMADETNARYHAYITVDKNAYDWYEFDDYYVSGSIFASFLVLSLHALGIGACIYRKDLYKDTFETKIVRNVAKIPNNEIIVLEIQLGKCDDDIYVPVSKRRSSQEIMCIVE